MQKKEKIERGTSEPERLCSLHFRFSEASRAREGAFSERAPFLRARESVSVVPVKKYTEHISHGILSAHLKKVPLSLPSPSENQYS